MALPKKLKAPNESIRQAFNHTDKKSILKAWRFNHFWRVYQVSNTTSSTRFATIIAKKYIPLSSQRNLIERIAHAWILNHYQEFPESYDYVFVWSFSVKKQLEKIILLPLNPSPYFDLTKIEGTFPEKWNHKSFKNTEVVSIYKQLIRQVVQKSFLWKTFDFYPPNTNN